MKIFIQISFFLFSSILFAQSDEKIFLKNDLSVLWTKTNESYVYGFIGENYQRIRIKILKVVKDSINTSTYNVVGKSKVKNFICDFRGTIKIIDIKVYKNMHFGADDELKNEGFKKQGELIAEYRFAENKSQLNSGIFTGTLTTYWYIDKNNNLKYDAIEAYYSDSYCNNQFDGIWESYDGKVIKICNWGDYRIPHSNDLDIGAAEFGPAEKYLKFGWDSFFEESRIKQMGADTSKVFRWWSK